MMTKIWPVVFFACVVVFQSCSNKATEIFVSEKDEMPGVLSYRSLKEAIDKAYQLKQVDSTTDIVIHIQPGNYYLAEPIVISPLLKGLIIKGEGSDVVSLKGSLELNVKWEQYNENIFVCDVEKDIAFDQLIVNGKTQILARYPDYNEEGGYWQGYAADAISKERIKTWEHPKGAIFHAMHKGKWGGFHYQVVGANEEGEPILEGGLQNNRPSKPHDEYRMVENVFEELDSPGEWYLDKENKKMYYWPASGVDISSAVFEGVVLKSLIQITGNEQHPVKNITIEGIRFQHTQRTLFEKYEPLLRSDWTIYRGAAIFFEGAKDCALNNCEFTNLGGNVVFVSGYNRNITIQNNHIHDCGASAICFVGDASAVRSPSFQYGNFVPGNEMDTVPGPKNNLYPKGCMAFDNLIYRIGRIEKQSAGVQISMAMDITVSHNSIYDVPRAGINIGDGTWGGHILEYNDVFNTVLETGDHGSFNSWGRDRFWHPKRPVMDSITLANPQMPLWDAIHTTIIRNNRFRCDHGWDIDLDDGSTNYHIYNNLCLSGGIKLREGFYRVVENNIMVNNSLHPHVWFVNCDDVIRENIFSAGYKDVNVLSWGKEMDYNLFPTEESMLKAQIYNIDANSDFGDPEFVNPEHMDFSVANHSPALKLGFVNFPMDQFGVLSAELKKLAHTPEIPELKNLEELEGKASPLVAWLRNEIKSVDSKEEQSAYGLNTAEGVIILKMWKGSYAAQGDGLKNKDVILKVEGEKVKDVKAFFNLLKKYNQAETVSMVVMRNQSEYEISVKVRK